MLNTTTHNPQAPTTNILSDDTQIKGKHWVNRGFMSVFPHNLNTNQDEIFDINEYPEIIPFLQSMIIEMQKFLKDYMTDEGTSVQVAQACFTPFEEVKKYLRPQTINGVNLDNQTLVNNIGDLLYNDLAGLLSAVGVEIQKDGDIKISLERKEAEIKMNYGENIKQAGVLVSQASQAIQEAWNISKDKPFPIEKHSSQVKGIEIPNIELANNISKLDYIELGHFLQLLALKIGQDGQKDKERGRIKLATELEKASNLLEQAGELLETGVYS